MESSTPKTLYLIDGHAQFFRAYHALRSGMSSPVTGEPTNLTYGFMGVLLKLLREYKPDYLAVVIDVSGDRESFRSEIFPEYKANRTIAPDDFHPQVERCLELLRHMDVPVLGREGVEADDVIASMVRRLREKHPHLRVRIVSKDKDLTQLIDENVELLDIYKDETVSASDIFKTEGVLPCHVVDILALMGDTIDNIPGVPGIGPKTAAQLILKYGTIDNLLAHLDEIKGKRRENLEAAKDLLSLSRRLVQLRYDLDVDFDLEQARWDAAHLSLSDLIAAFRQLGFNQHMDTIRRLAGNGKAAAPAGSEAITEAAAVVRRRKRESGEMGLFDEMGGVAGVSVETRPTTIEAEYTAIRTLEQLDALIAQARKKGIFAFDTETTTLSPMRADLCGVSLAIEKSAGFYIPTRSCEFSSHLDTDAVIGRLQPLFEDDSVAKVGHNIKYDMIVFRRLGLKIRGPLFDTMVASYLVDSTRSSHSLDVLALALLKHTCIPISDLIGRGSRQKPFDDVPLDQAVPYSAEDATVALCLHEVLRSQLKAMELLDLFHDVEMPLVEVLAELEFNGIRVDPDELDLQRQKLAKRIDSLRDRIANAAPHPFNPDSPKQLAAALFNRPDQDPPGLGLKPFKRGKTGPSTDQEVLEKLAEDPSIKSRVPKLITEYRQLTKLVNTYLVALKEEINPDTGRVHASFNQTVAATGRLSSSDPNLQNIPIRTDVGREIRRAFVAEPGNVLITADYSQIELRLLAHLSGDPALIEAFREGHDIHAAVAAEVFGVKPEDVTIAQRSTAKMVNFGIVYGITPFGLARRLGPDVSKDDARQIISDYKNRFSRIESFLSECIASALLRGYVETILKRRRLIPQIQARHPQQRALGERMAINTVVQGSAADLIKLAMVDLYRRLPQVHPEAKMLLQIHDELVFECPQSAADAVQSFAVERMQSAMALSVPLVVDSARSTIWIDAK